MLLALQKVRKIRRCCRKELLYQMKLKKKTKKTNTLGLTPDKNLDISLGFL